MRQSCRRCDNRRSLNITEQNMAQIDRAEYWAQKDGVKLYVYRKHAAGLPKDAPVLFLVHGSSASGRSSFDLDVPGRTD